MKPKPPELDVREVHRVTPRRVPRFHSVAFGRSPDNAFLVLLNGERIMFHFDSTWGKRGYFRRGEEWYWFDLYEVPQSEDYTLGLMWDLRKVNP